MAAEAIMILEGSNRVEDTALYCKKMKDFSDDGITLSGAYGPPVITQLSYVVETLVKDTCSRQAVLTIWHPRPRPSKDIPCTISLHFMIRDCKLNCAAHMRSSDIFLGVPYDVFNFSMIAHRVLLALPLSINIGSLFLIANSQHLYESNIKIVQAILESDLADCKTYAPCRFASIEHQLDALYEMRSTGNLVLS
jgi:thymidylate synthase